MKKLKSETADAAVRVLTKAGADPTVEQRRKHIKIAWTTANSDLRMMFCSSTPSDWRASKKAVSLAKRLNGVAPTIEMAADIEVPTESQAESRVRQSAAPARVRDYRLGTSATGLRFAAMRRQQEQRERARPANQAPDYFDMALRACVRACDQMVAHLAKTPPTPLPLACFPRSIWNKVRRYGWRGRLAILAFNGVSILIHSQLFESCRIWARKIPDRDQLTNQVSDWVGVVRDLAQELVDDLADDKLKGVVDDLEERYQAQAAIEEAVKIKERTAGEAQVAEAVKATFGMKEGEGV